MTNIERQKSLDKLKYEQSKNFKKDLSGEMYYCAFCDKSIKDVCQASQKEREQQSLCAKAFNRYTRIKRKNNKILII